MPAVLWRWNGRLAMVAGGLTLVFIGACAGRLVELPSAPSNEAPISSAAANEGAIASPTAVAAEVDSGEVNPELIVMTSPTLAAVDEEIAVSTVESTEKPAAGVSIPTAPIPTQVAAVSPPTPLPCKPTTEDSSGEASLPSKETQAVSAEGKVAAIRLPPLAPVCAAEEKFKDRKLKTALDWAESGNAAAQQAAEEEKLVFLIHISGNFEVPGFT
jgi:hypothetical protein